MKLVVFYFVKLNQPPTFFREINPQPRKHTLWQQSPDFTGGQAPNWRYIKYKKFLLQNFKPWTFYALVMNVVYTCNELPSCNEYYAFNIR